MLPSKTAVTLGTKPISSQSAVSNIFFWFLELAFYHEIGAIIITKCQYLVPHIYSPGCTDEIPRDINKSV